MYIDQRMRGVIEMVPNKGPIGKCKNERPQKRWCPGNYLTMNILNQKARQQRGDAEED